jgi:Arc/MetJ-type ribon-helix-helix transcriptional regulator
MKKKSNPSTTSKTELIAFRCPVELKKKINDAVESQQFQSVTDLIVQSVSEKLDAESNLDS